MRVVRHPRGAVRSLQRGLHLSKSGGMLHLVMASRGQVFGQHGVLNLVAECRPESLTAGKALSATQVAYADGLQRPVHFFSEQLNLDTPEAATPAAGYLFARKERADAWATEYSARQTAVSAPAIPALAAPMLSAAAERILREMTDSKNLILGVGRSTNLKL